MRKYDPETQTIIDGLPTFNNEMQESDMVALLGESERFEWNRSQKEITLLKDLLYATLNNKLISTTEESRTHMSKIIRALRLLGE